VGDRLAGFSNREDLELTAKQLGGDRRQAWLGGGGQQV
jgi:hypothetical protein